MIFGRDVELASIELVAKAVRDGGPSVLVLRGEPGIGKTVLLRHAATAGHDLNVVAARAIPTESALPFAFLSAVVRPLMTYADELPKIQSGSLRAAIGEEERSVTDVFLLGAAVLGLVAEAARHRPVLLLLDDVHWADEISLRAIVFALLRLERDSVGAILTQRDVAVPSVDASGFAVINPTRLDVTSVAALIESVNGKPPSPGVAQQLTESTGGNPLALVELAGSLDGEALRGTTRLPSPLPVGEKLLNVYAQRLHALPVDTRRALMVAAASDEQSGPVMQAVRILGGSSTDLDAAERAELVASTGDRITFRHPLIRAAVIGLADPVERRSAHRALARVPQLSTEARAWHLAASTAGPDADAAAALVAAAGSAAARGDPASAAEMWSRAAELTPDAGQRASLLADAAAAAMAAGHPERCRTLAHAGLRDANDEAVRGRLLASTAALAPEPQAAHAILIEAASLLAPHDGLAAIRALSEALNAGLATRSVELIRQSVDHARGLDRPGEPQTLFFRDCLVGAGLAITGDLAKALLHFGNALTAMQEQGPLRDDPEACAEAIHVAGYLGRTDLAGDLVERALHTARTRGMVSVLPDLIASRAEVATWHGDWPRAAALTAEAAELCRAMGDEDGYTSRLAYLGWFHVHRGDAIAASESARSRLTWADARGITRDRPPAVRTLAVLDLRAGRPERAVRRLRAETELPFDGRGVRTGPLTVVEDLVDAALLAGNAHAAEQSVKRLSSYAQISPDPLASALAARCRAQLAVGDDVAEEFATALRFHERDPDAFATARTWLCFGEWLRRGGRRVDAREYLHAALNVFDRLDATPWLERAGAELRATGESIGRRDEARLRLTAQELRTAMTVAQGLTNREVAERLFVSVKTVEFHLGAVFRKLGVRSRTELARHPLIARDA